MAKRLKIDDTSVQVKDFLRQLDIEKEECVLKVEGKSLVGVVSSLQVEKLFLNKAGNGIARWEQQRPSKL